MKKTIFIAASLLALAACNKEVIYAPAAGGMGTLNLSVASDDNITVVTKAAVSTDAFTVNIINDEETVVKTGTPTALAVVLLDADTYHVYAENMTADAALEGNGKLHIAGQCAPFELVAGGTATAVVNCESVNSKITVSFADSFTNAFSSYTVNYDQLNGDRDFTNVVAGTDYYYNITENNIVDVKLTATAAHDSSSHTHTQQITLQAGYHYSVVYSAGSNGQVTVTVTADDHMELTNVPVEVNPYQNN